MACPGFHRAPVNPYINLNAVRIQQSQQYLANAWMGGHRVLMGRGRRPTGNPVGRPRKHDSLRGAFPCQDCGVVFGYRSTLVQHKKRICGKEPQHKCPHCEYASKIEGNLRRHMNKKHPQEFLSQGEKWLSHVNWGSSLSFDVLRVDCSYQR